MNENIIRTYINKDYRITYKFKEGSSYIVFLHGLSGTKEYFDQAFLSNTNLESGILSIDIPGFGDSEVLDGDYSIKIQAKRILEIIDQLNIKDIYLVGHSYSGPICHEIFKLYYKKEIKGIILAESSIKPHNSWATNIASKSLEEYKEIFQKTYKDRYEFYKEALVDKKDENVLTLTRGIEKTTPEAMFFSSKELIKYCYNIDLIEQLSLVEVPVEYILGSKNKSALQEDENIKKLKDSNVKIRVIENSGHCMMLDNPESFYSVIRDFINNKGF